MPRAFILPFLAALISATIFFTGITWGLPSRTTDAFLYGNHPIWTGAEIAALAPTESDDRGADVDANPISAATQPVVLNATDAQRAEIIRRYRLFSYQPDEMITFKSLSRIKQNHGDPRLYQYGGLWIYPVGALIKLTLNPASDQAYYLDHPEQFGRFYVVARAYSATWGVIGALMVFHILRKLTRSSSVSFIGAIAFACMPVVITMAHEAKPHLAGVTLILLSMAAAMRYQESRSKKWAVIAGALAGAAAAMVLTGVIAFIVLVAMEFRRWRILTLAIAVGLVVYVVTNPFVPINAIAHRQLLRSNLANTSAMYHVSFAGVFNAIGLIAAGATWLVLIVGVGSVAFLSRGLGVPPERSRLEPLVEPAASRQRSGETPKPRISLLLAPVALSAIQFFLFASGKPPEYARFALLIDVTLLIAAFPAISRLHKKPSLAAAVVVFVLVALSGFFYERAFIRDCTLPTSRLLAAEKLFDRPIIHLAGEPAPYNTPPLNLFDQQLILDRDHPDLIVVPGPAPISWADVRFWYNDRDAPPR